MEYTLGLYFLPRQFFYSFGPPCPFAFPATDNFLTNVLWNNIISHLGIDVTIANEQAKRLRIDTLQMVFQDPQSALNPRRSVEELKALGEVSQALNSTLDLENVLNTIVSRANQLAGTDSCSVYEYDEVREEFLRPSISGDYVACLGVSETGAGSDVASIKTNARRVGGDWVINGGKMWTTNGTQADWMCLLANTGEGPVHKNKSLICLPMKTRGVQVVKKLDKLGMRSSDTAQIFLDEVKVPVRNLIGQEGMGFAYQMQQFQEERLWGAISAVVGMERLIAETAEYTRERKVFGRPLLDNQIIHFKLAELSTEVELVRSLCYRACEEYLDGKDVTMLTSMAKLKAGRMVRLVTDGCLQYWGGAGYLWDNPVARSYRDGRLGSIGGGADEVMLQIIAKLQGNMPRLGNR